MPIWSRKLERFPDRELVTHGGVVRYFMDHYTPLNPLLRMSPEQGNCPSIYRMK